MFKPFEKGNKLHLGIKHSPETRRKISEKAKGNRSKNDNGNWKGGINDANIRRELIAGRAKPVTCEVCGDGNKRIVFDHDHATGHFRGWICNGCNCILGFARDKVEVLQKLIDYLNKPNHTNRKLTIQEMKLLNIYQRK